MRHIKKFYVIAALIISTLAFQASVLPAQAYTEEEKQMVKNWLSSHGYPPTMDGAYQAYQDYLDGKYDSSGNAIDPSQPQTGEPQTYSFDDNTGDGTGKGSGDQSGNGDGQKGGQPSGDQTETAQTDSETENETETQTESQTETETETQTESETRAETEKESETATQPETQTEVKNTQSQVPDWGKTVVFGVTVVAAGGTVAGIKYRKKKKE